MSAQRTTHSAPTHRSHALGRIAGPDRPERRAGASSSMAVPALESAAGPAGRAGEFGDRPHRGFGGRLLLTPRQYSWYTIRLRSASERRTGHTQFPTQVHRFWRSSFVPFRSFLRRPISSTTDPQSSDSDSPTARRRFQFIMAKAGAVQAVSLRPSDFVAGGGLPNDIDIEITGAGTEMFTYPGGDTESLSVRIDFVNIETGEKGSQNLSAGKNFVPNDEGTGFVPTGSATALTDGSNFFIFLASLCNEGFPEEKVGNDVSVFVGTQLHIERKEQKEVQKGKKRECIVCTQIIALPWEPKKKKKVASDGTAAKPAAGSNKTGVAAPKAGTGAKPAAKAAAAADAPDAEDVGTRAAEVLTEIVAESEGTVARSKIRGAAFKKLMKEPGIRNAVLALFDNDEELTAVCEAAGLSFDGETIAA